MPGNPAWHSWISRVKASDGEARTLLTQRNETQMKLVSILSEGGRFAGVLEDDQVFVTSVPGLDAAIARGIKLKDQPGNWRKASSVQFDVPLRPECLLCTGNNYKDHLDERQPAAHTRWI